MLRLDDLARKNKQTVILPLKSHDGWHMIEISQEKVQLAFVMLRQTLSIILPFSCRFIYFRVRKCAAWWIKVPCTLKMVDLRFLFFSLKINVSLESFNFEKEIWKKRKYSPRKWDDRFPPEVKVYFWLTDNWCECSHPEWFSRERLFMGEPPYILFPEAFYVRLCYIFVVRARFSKLWLCYGKPQAAEMSVG